MGKSAPRPPSPERTAAAQSQMNRETAITQQNLNMVGQSGPFGNVSYAQVGTWADGTPRYEQTTSLDPNAQAALDASLEAQSNLAGLASSQASRLQTSLADPFEFTNRDAEMWAYDLAAPRILQQQGQNDASLRAMLAQKGIREGSAAWNAEMQRLTNANTDQLNQLALAGRGQAFNEALASRNQPLTELGAILGMGMSGVTPPSQAYGATPQTGVTGVDYAGLVNQNYQQQLANYQNQMGGLFGLGSSIIGAAGAAGGFGALFSDERLKTDVKRIGQTDSGIPIYTYRYVWGGPVHMGVMAQDVPSAAIETPSGFLAVDYGRLS